MIPTVNPNGTMVRSDLLDEPLAVDIWTMMRDWRAGGLEYTNWWGSTDNEHVAEETLKNCGDYQPLPGSYGDAVTPWFAIWEYCWMLRNVIYRTVGWRNGEVINVLDLGGAFSPLSIWLCSNRSVFLTTVDSSPVGSRLHGNAVESGALRIGILDAWETFDLLEWLEMHSRVGRDDDWVRYDAVISVSTLCLLDKEKRKKVAELLPKVMHPGAYFGWTFDYKNPNPNRYIDNPRGAFISPRASDPGLVCIGGEFEDRGERQLVYYPDASKPKYTMGAQVLRRVL